MTSKVSKTLIITALALVAAGAVTLCAVFDPETHPAPKCIFKSLTGWDCPGCGTQRAIHAMASGDISAAWNFNPMLFFAIPLVILYFISEYKGQGRLYGILHHWITAMTIAVLIIFWWIGRNVI